jgi:3-phenylpropionate/trans-cinnamate dioxygenase ferredoxin reductase subunit
MAESPSAPIVVVGAGLAGGKAVEELRSAGYPDALTLLGEEPHRPYERPPLTKDYLAGKSAREKVFVHAESWYAEHDVDLRTGTTVTGIDTSTHEVVLGSGERLEFSKLLLATGASPRRLRLSGSTVEPSERILYLRTVDDSERLKSWLQPGSSIAIVGGGWIGLECAATARTAGATVTVLEADSAPLVRVLGPEVAQVFADAHREHGVDLRCDVTVSGIEEGRDGVRVVLGSGEHVDADVVLVGVGVIPNTALAEAAGIAVDNGVLTDESLRTSHPDVWAAGDVANAQHPLLGYRLRVEHWATALHQPAVAARAMLGEDVRYERLPYFYSDQYDLSAEYVGHVAPDGDYRLVLRPFGDDGGLVALWLLDDRVRAGLVVNAGDELPAIKELLRSGRPVDATSLADVNVPLG